MNAQALIDTGRALVTSDKGLLAMNISSPICNKRFARLRISQTEETRRIYRELITLGLDEYISDAIITGTEIIPDNKANTGAKEMEGHSGWRVTEGLDGLRARLKEYWALAFSFSRAIQRPAVEIWSDRNADVNAAKQAMLQLARCNQTAHRGKCSAAMEVTGA